jgi:hypothetical protein
MRVIVLDGASRSLLLAQRAAKRSGEPVPTRWHGLLDTLSLDAAGIGAAERDWRHVLIGRACLVAWQLSPEAIATAARGRGLVYLCWGVGDRPGWKGAVERMVLRRAEHVLVNDATTAGEVTRIAGRQAHLVPFFVDTDYFAFRPLEGRQRFLFCNGFNDRDPEVLVGLAERGFQVVWLVNDAAMSARYASRHPNLSLASGLSFAELRRLYQTCAAAVMPALRDAHAAGQTTGTEAVACGTPLAISAGRTAGIFAGLPSVRAVSTRDANVWVDEVGDLLKQANLARMAEVSADIIRRRITKEHVIQALMPFLLAGRDQSGMRDAQFRHPTASPASGAATNSPAK